jgi:hypothetical protein
MEARQTSVSTQYRSAIDKALKNIKYGYLAGLFSGGVTLALFISIIANPTASRQFGVYSWLIFLDVVVILGLSYGIYLKNHACAVFLMCYFLIGKAIQIHTGTFPPLSAPLATLLIFCYYRSMIGTSEYHRLQGEYDRLNLHRLNIDKDGNVDRIVDRNITIVSNDGNPDRIVNRDLNPAASVTKFWIADRLMELCDGDRSQAEWLLHQLRRQHPNRSVDWYNDLAIEQMTKSIR